MLTQKILWWLDLHWLRYILEFPLLSTDNSLFILALILASLFDSFPPSDVNGLNSGADR